MIAGKADIHMDDMDSGFWYFNLENDDGTVTLMKAWLMLFVGEGVDANNPFEVCFKYDA